ncbi:DNA-directed RNA polymerase subunit H [Candidatus Woesearchaeota archaeon]|nr:DNA-directed RNA polymerase subunit H [Candidatus Woesearchaeota archaeon]
MAFDLSKHLFVPKHSKLKDTEKEKLLQEFHLSKKVLPKIFQSDPAIAKLEVKPGDVIKVERESKTAGASFYYRTVIEG